ncbi:MAG: hypothetical protein ACOYMD_11795 [Paludibacter sp.]
MNNLVFDQRDNASLMDYYVISPKRDVEVILVAGPTEKIIVPQNTLIGQLTGFSTRIMGTLYDQVLLINPGSTGKYGAVKNGDCIYQVNKPIETPVIKKLPIIPIAIAAIGLLFFFGKK